MRSSRHVVVELGGEVLADTRRAVLLFETSLPMRAYVPRDDVRMELLVPTGSATRCAYKGEARYWSVEGAGEAGEDICWSYEAPLHDAAQVQDLIAFYDERTDVTIDGERQERPNTPWSPNWDGRMA
jgi:uncharacterized protein (DUF427 family)